MMNSIAILPAQAYRRERIRHFTAYVEVFRHDTANGFSGEGTPAAQPVAEAKPVNPVKDKVRAMRELLLSDEYAEQKKKRSTALC